MHLKAVFPPLNLALMRISRLHFKQSKNSMLITRTESRYVLPCFVIFGDVIGDVWKENKALVNLREIRNSEDLI